MISVDYEKIHKAKQLSNEKNQAISNFKLNNEQKLKIQKRV